MNTINRLVVIGSLIGYVLLGLFGLLAMQYVHDHAHSAMNHCPFMVGQQALCAMDTVGHIAAWQASSVTTVLTLFVIVVPALFLIHCILSVSSIQKRHYHTKPLFESFFVQLFSSGILHSKVY